MPRVDPLNRTRYWQDRNTPGLELMQADLRTHSYPPHRHDSLVIAITEYGGSVLRTRGAEHEAREHVLSVFNPMEPHAGIMGGSTRWRFRSLYLEEPALAEVAGGLGVDGVPYFTETLVPDHGLIDGFRALHRGLQAGRDVLRQRELLITTFGALFERHGSPRPRIDPGPRDRVRLRTVVGLMQDRLGDTLTLAELSTAVGLTEFQLTGLFKRTTGMTPHAYLTQLRLDRARRRLRAGRPIAETATACGFYDQAALTKHFKRCYGVTPLQYARA